MTQVDLDMLRELAWSGTPSDLRPLCWQLLLGYLPPNRDRRCAATTACVNVYCAGGCVWRGEGEMDGGGGGEGG